MSRRGVGIALMFVGGAVAVAGLGMALRGLIGLYSGALDDPLVGGEEDSKPVARQMLIWAAVGAAGAVPLAVGSMIFWIDYLRKRSGRTPA